MLTLHHLENSQSIRILWLLEELGVPYEMKMYDRDKKTGLAPDEYKKISPLGTAPVITDGDLVLAETNAIVDYILDTYGEGKLRPAVGTPQYVPYLFWFHAAQGSFQPLLTTVFVLGVMVTRVPFFLRPIIGGAVETLNKAFFRPRLTALLGEIERQLSETRWFAGEELTAADIVMGYSMEVAALRAGMGKKYPNAKRFLDAMHARPAYKRAVEKDGKYNPLPG
ncbi:MAG: glutathione S-transferase family protein [Alphaproteobacteria bacterium]|nr:glutathione S-transferase family protein [Alphaproteobacteria bacterium]MBO6627808.1 glutathione S-transferase family protein [Alphaproteobacteria bacterium]MDF1628041.1 glutathione S-transferase family protein [Parvibaculaceae bacterium]|tara:strand:+ start:374 stop:1045 length:672 start_codon:yes stop_codon:yes gene_type:complete